MVCKGCKTSAVALEEDFCISCREKIQKHLISAKDYLVNNDFSKASEELTKLLGMDSSHQEAQKLKKDAEDKLKVIEDLHLKVEACLKEEHYKDAAGYLNELIKLVPLDQNVRLQKQMMDLVSLTDPMSFVRPYHQRFKPSDFVEKNYALPASSMILGVSLAIVIGLAALVNHLYGRQFKDAPVRDIYRQLHEMVSREEYYNASFLTGYTKLINEHSDTEYFKKIQKEINKAAPRLIKGYLNRGKALADRGLYNEAIEEYGKVFVFDLFHREATILITQARGKMTLHDLPASESREINASNFESAVSKILQNIPVVAREYLLSGEDFFKKEEYFRAIVEWKKAQGFVLLEDLNKIQILIDHAKRLQINSQREYVSLVQKADELFKAQNWDDAQDYFEKALKINPADAFVQGRLLEIKYILNPPSVSEKIAFKNDLFYLLRYYITYRIQENKSLKFKKYYQRALLEDEANRLKKANYYYKKSDQYGEMSSHINKQVKINTLILTLEKRLRDKPQDYNAKISLGCLYYAKGWLDKAENMWDSLKFQQSKTSGIGLLINLLKAKVAEKRKNISAAQGIYEESLKSGDIFYVRNSLAQLLWLEGLIDEAIQNWQMVLAKNPYQLDVMSYLARGLVVLNKQEELNLLFKKFSNFNLLRIRKGQCYPLDIDPEYFVMLVSENEYFRRSAASLSQFYIDLGDVAEAIRWQRISLELEAKKK